MSASFGALTRAQLGVANLAELSIVVSASSRCVSDGWLPVLETARTLHGSLPQLQSAGLHQLERERRGPVKKLTALQQFRCRDAIGSPRGKESALGAESQTKSGGVKAALPPLTNTLAVGVEIVAASRDIGLLVVSDIIDLMLLHELGVDGPGSIFDHLVDPLAVTDGLVSLSGGENGGSLVCAHELI